LINFKPGRGNFWASLPEKRDSSAAIDSRRKPCPSYSPAPGAPLFKWGDRRLMRWFRTNRQFGARFALIALALQLLLTFGHVHAPSAALASAAQTSQSDGTVPQGPNHSGLADTDCPTCALIQLSAISAPSVAPELPLPVAVGFSTLQPRVGLTVASAPPASVRARGPPAV
jgi:hypothetical protein